MMKPPCPFCSLPLQPALWHSLQGYELIEHYWYCADCDEVLRIDEREIKPQNCVNCRYVNDLSCDLQYINQNKDNACDHWRPKEGST